MRSLSPPHNLDMEEALLSACLCDHTGNAFARTSAILQPEDWFSPALGHVIAAISELVRRSKPVDPTLVVEELRCTDRLAQIGGIPFITRLVNDVPIAPVIEEYAKTLHKLARARKMIRALQEATAKGYEAADVDAWLAETADAVVNLGAADTSRPIRPMSAVVLDAFKDMDRAAEARARGNGIAGLSTGFRNLDALLDGTRDGNLIILGARPGMGKSSLAFAWAANVAKDPGGEFKPGVALWSLEMPDVEQAQRGFAMESGVALRDIRAGRFDARSDDKFRCLEAARHLSSDYLWVSDQPGLTLTQLESDIRKVRTSFARMRTPDGRRVELKLGVIDYLQLMRGVVRKGGNREQEISEISRGLKHIAKANQMAILALAQLNRGLESRADKRPMPSDLRESGSLEQDADVIAFLYRDAFYSPLDVAGGGDPPPFQIAECIVAKQRSGPTGTAYFDWHGSTTSFQDYAECSPEEARRRYG